MSPLLCQSLSRARVGPSSIPTAWAGVMSLGRESGTCTMPLQQGAWPIQLVLPKCQDCPVRTPSCALWEVMQMLLQHGPGAPGVRSDAPCAVQGHCWRRPHSHFDCTQQVSIPGLLLSLRVISSSSASLQELQSRTRVLMQAGQRQLLQIPFSTFAKKVSGVASLKGNLGNHRGMTAAPYCLLTGLGARLTPALRGFLFHEATKVLSNEGREQSLGLAGGP